MNKKILLTLGALLVTSSLIASNCNTQKNSGPKSCDTKPNCSTTNCSSKGGFIPLVMGLDLSDEQRTKIHAIVENSFKKMPNLHDAFSDTNFDKKKFIELSKQKREAKLERKAQMMYDVHTILTKEQKKELKKQLDAKPMMCDSKPNSCDGTKPSKKRSNN